MPALATASALGVGGMGRPALTMVACQDMLGGRFLPRAWPWPNDGRRYRDQTRVNASLKLTHHRQLGIDPPPGVLT